MTPRIEERPPTRATDYEYSAFGLALRIDSRLSIPGLGGGRGTVSAEPRPLAPDRPASRIRLNAAELNRRWDAIATTPARTREVRVGETLVRTVDFAEPAGYLLWARDYGRVLISPNGLELLCEPDPVNEHWASIVSSQALPLAATLRGFEVVHASGVVLDDGAVLIAGPAGAGKSSLAAALLRTGGRLLSDDAVALELSDGALVAHAGSVALQLRPAEHERLSAEERAALGDPAGSLEGKRRYVTNQVPDAAPLAHVFLLERSAREPAVERLEAVDPFELLASTFNLSVRTPARLHRQLDVVSAIASGRLVHRLRVQPGVDATRLAQVIREHVGGTSMPAGHARVDLQHGGASLLEL
jgi:hypothetical protein